LVFFDKNKLKVFLLFSFTSGVARRKIIYLELYPETKKGGYDRSINDKMSVMDTLSFSQTTANITSQSESQVLKLKHFFDSYLNFSYFVVVY
jgi:hypothetical protein